MILKLVVLALIALAAVAMIGRLVTRHSRRIRRQEERSHRPFKRSRKRDWIRRFARGDQRKRLTSRVEDAEPVER